MERRPHVPSNGGHGLQLTALPRAISVPDGGGVDTELIRLTVNEVRRLINTLIIEPVRDLAHRLHLCHWRRHHQAQARRSHYKGDSTSNFSHDPQRRLSY